MSNWTFNELDAKVASGIQEFLPSRIFDTHAHIYRRSDLNLTSPSFITEGPDVVDLKMWRNEIEKMVGKGRVSGGLILAMPEAKGDIDKTNNFLIEELKKTSDCRGLVVVAPTMDRAKVLGWLKEPKVVGFKPYHCYSESKPTFQAPLASFLPEWIWEIANERGLIITLHMVKTLALSDPDNQKEIRSKCLKYPNAKLILAHAARGFHVYHTLEGLDSLRGLQNVWFDTAAVCESAAIVGILKSFGPRKVMWGSDYPVSQIRGRCVTVGDGFAWLDPGSVQWEKLSPGCNPVLVGIESLRVMKEVADSFGLNQDDLNDIFCDNALRLAGIKQEPANQTQEYYKYAKKRIPGGTQLLSKRPEMLAPEQWPAYFREARGCEVWDLDNKHYYDFSTNGIGACALGFRDPDVTQAVIRRVNLGSMSTLNPPEEVELADLLCEIHPWASQVRFTRSGGETGGVAIRIARATTDRSLIAICGYHGWQDWYLAANLGNDDALRGHLLPGLDPLGVPRELRGTALPFRYNDREAFENILKNHGDKLAAVIMEPCRYQDPSPGFLEFVRDGAHRVGAFLIFDEITIGWRLVYGGAHLKYGVKPDIAMFAKAIGNGHPMGAVIGTDEAMADAQSSFISSTYWTESVGPAAALATLRKMKECDLVGNVAKVGTRVQNAWKKSSEKYGLPATVEEGFPCLAHFKFDHELAGELRTLYIQLMLERGILSGTAIYPTLAHTDEVVEIYEKAIDEVFGQMSDIISRGKIKESLKGPIAHSGFRRLL